MSNNIRDLQCFVDIQFDIASGDYIGRLTIPNSRGEKTHYLMFDHVFAKAIKNLAKTVKEKDKAKIINV